MGIAENWLVLAVASPVFWAVICLIDSCFVGKGLYRSALDGPVLAGLFCTIPLVIWQLFGLDNPVAADSATAISTLLHSREGEVVAALRSSVLAAVFYSLHIFFYFRTLFKLNDSANTESILALSVALVPVFAWFLLGERLSALIYAAIALTALGLVVSSWSTLQRICFVESAEQSDCKLPMNLVVGAVGKQSRSTMCEALAGLGIVANLVLAVVCFSLYMVLQAKAFDALDFGQVTLSFNMTMMLLSLFVLVSSAHYRRRIVNLLRRYMPIFLCAEGLELAARLAAQRAIEVGPSVTAVALIQCLLPPLIIVTSFLLMGSDRLWHFLSPVTRQTLALQCEGLIAKTTLLSLTIMALLVFQFESSLP